MKALRHTLITALLAASLTGCGSSADSAADFVASGKDLLAEGKVEKASLEFRNAIQIDPTQAEPFYQLALLDEKSQNWKGMYANLTTAEQLDPTHQGVSVKLGQLFLLSGDYEKASERAKKVLDVAPEQVGALVLRASINMRQKNYGAANKDVDLVLSLDPENIEALSVKAILYKEQGDTAKTLSTIEHALSIDPDNMALVAMKLAVYEERKEFDKVESIYRELMVKTPDELWIVKSLARLLNMQGDYAGAKEEIRTFVDNHADHQEAKLLLLALIQTKEPDAAVALLDEYIAQEPDNYDFRFAKVSLQLKQEQTEQALETLQAISAKDPDGNNGRRADMILANYAFQQGDVDSAREKVTQALESAPEDENALMLQAKLNLLDGDVDTAVTNLRIVLRNNPEAVDAMTLLGRAYASTGSVQLAEDHFRQALKLAPGNVTAALFVSERLMATDNVERAEAVVTKALAMTPDNEPLLQVLAQIKLAQRDWAGSEEVVASLKTQNQSSVMAQYLDGRILQGQEQYQEAISQYQALLKTAPTMTAALEQLTYCYLQLSQLDELKAYLTDFTAANPQQIPAHRVLANVYIKEQNWPKAIETIEAGLSAEANWQNGYLLLANISQAQGDMAQAEADFKRGLAVLPESNAIALPLASLYESLGQFEQAKTLYEDIVERNPDLDVAVNNLASLLTDKFTSAENLERARTLTMRFESAVEPYFMDTYAWVYAQLGELEKAKSVLERVVIKAPEVAVFNYHLGSVYHQLAQTSEAEQYLMKAKSQATEQQDTQLLNEINALLN